MKNIFVISAAIFLLNSFAATVTAQSKTVPIIDMKIGFLLGGVQNGQYLDAATTASRLPAEQNYTLYLFNGGGASLMLKKPGQKPEDEICGDNFAIETEAGDVENRFKKGGIALGEGFDWNPQPRPVQSINLNSAQYKKVAADFLRTKGFVNPVVKLAQAVRVDLDGDGREEVLLSATRVFRYTEKDKKKFYDEYSFILLRKIINGKPRTILVNGEFAPKNRTFYDGYTYLISSVLDLDGNGRMELVVYQEYYEGSSAAVYQITGSKVVQNETLTAGCGL